MADLAESLIRSDLDLRVRARKVCRLPEHAGGNSARVRRVNGISFSEMEAPYIKAAQSAHPEYLSATSNDPVAVGNTPSARVWSAPVHHEMHVKIERHEGPLRTPFGSSGNGNHQATR